MSDFPSFCDVRLVGRIVSLSGERALVEYRGRTGIVTVRVSVPGGARGKLDDVVRVLGELAEDGHVMVSEDKGEFIAASVDAKTTLPDDPVLSSIPSTAVSPTPEADVALPSAATVPEVSPPSTVLPDNVPAVPAATTTPTPRPALAPPFPARPFGSGLRSGIGRSGVPRPSSTAAVVVAQQAQPPAVRQPPAGLSAAAGPRSSFQRPGMMRSVGLVSPAAVKAAPQQAASLPTATDAPLSPAQTAQTSSTPTTAPQTRPPPTPARRSSMMAVSRLSDDDDPRNVPGGDTEQESQGFHTGESPPVSRGDVVSSSPSRGVPHSRKPPTNPDDIDRDIPF